MKGQVSMPEDIGWTIFIVIIVFFVAIITLLLYGRARLLGSSDTFVYSLEFVNLAVKPYLVGESLSFLPIGDRQFFENALEGMVAGSMERASTSDDAIKDLKEFVDEYKFKRYFIEIKNDSLNVFVLDNVVRRCGEDSADSDYLPDGVCVSKFHEDFDTCGIGRVEIDDKEGCRFYQSCCKDDENSFAIKHSTITITRCASSRGICSKNLGPPSAGGILGVCSEGREYYPDASCPNSIPICCIPQTPESLEQGGFVTSAEIPLFFNETKHYKNANSMIEVSIG